MGFDFVVDLAIDFNIFHFTIQDTQKKRCTGTNNMTLKLKHKQLKTLKQAIPQNQQNTNYWIKWPLVLNVFISQIRRKWTWMKLYFVQRNHIWIQILHQESIWGETHEISHQHSLTITIHNRKKVPMALHNTMVVTKCNACQSLPSNVTWFLYLYVETTTIRTWKQKEWWWQTLFEKGRAMATNLNVLPKLVDNSNLKILAKNGYTTNLNDDVSYILWWWAWVEDKVVMAIWLLAYKAIWLHAKK